MQTSSVNSRYILLTPCVTGPLADQSRAILPDRQGDRQQPSRLRVRWPAKPLKAMPTCWPKLSAILGYPTAEGRWRCTSWIASPDRDRQRKRRWVQACENPLAHASGAGVRPFRCHGFPGRRTTTGASDARGRETELLLHVANPLPLRLRDLRPVPLPSPSTGSNALLHRVALSSQKSDIDPLFPFPYIGHYDNMRNVRLEREPGGQRRVALAKGARPRAAGSVMAHHGQTPGLCRRTSWR